MSEIPKPNLQQAISVLKGNREEWNTLTDFIRAEREMCFGDLGRCENPNEVMKIAGGIARLDELLQVLSPPTG